MNIALQLTEARKHQSEMTDADELAQVKTELAALRQALRRWSASTNYAEACHHWAEIKRLMNLHIPPTEIEGRS